MRNAFPGRIEMPAPSGMVPTSSELRTLEVLVAELVI